MATKCWITKVQIMGLVLWIIAGIFVDLTAIGLMIATMMMMKIIIAIIVVAMFIVTVCSERCRISYESINGISYFTINIKYSTANILL